MNMKMISPRKSGAKRGFTLIELMIVVAIIGILAAIAIPKFADLIRKSGEGATKGSLGAVRSALAIYYGDMEGLYPVNLASLTISGKYLGSVPTAKTPNFHVDSSGIVDAVEASAVTNAGGWSYVNATATSNFGTIWVNCSDTDTKNTRWTAY